MTLRELQKILDAKVIAGEENLDREISHAFTASNVYRGDGLVKKHLLEGLAKIGLNPV